MARAYRPTCYRTGSSYIHVLLTGKARDAALELEIEEIKHADGVKKFLNGWTSYIYKMPIRVHIWLTKPLKNLKDKRICQWRNILFNLKSCIQRSKLMI